MKISLSPGRAGVRNPPASLSTSRSRRLRNSGSIRGGASPATFSAKKRGSFDNPEPSSPKVTCIGQVRVRSRRKQRSLSKRRSAGHPLNGFPSKRHKHKESLNLGSKGTQNDQNQECSPAQRKWAHFPVTICDSLRAFGSELSCLFPCRGKEEKTVAAEDGGSGEEVARWLVAVEDGDMELVEGNEEEEEEEERVWKSRRHVFEDLRIVGDRIEGREDESRGSVCVPPKNALLLMRGRSDPMKIEALANRSWEPSVAKTDEEDEIVDNSEDQIEEDLRKPLENLEVEQEQVMILDQEQDIVQQDGMGQVQEQDEVGQVQEHNRVQQDEANQDQEHDIVQQDEVGQDQEHDGVQQDESNQDQEHDNVPHYEVGQDQEHDSMQQDEVGQEQEQDIVQQDEVGQNQEHDNVQHYEVGQGQEHNQTEDEEESFYLVSLFEEIVNQDYEIQEQDEVVEIESTMTETHEEEEMVLESEVKEKKESEEVLPECLLMMMYEPKLSMEVSKETWVCRTDFIQRQSSRRKQPAPVPAPDKDGSGDELSVSATVNHNDVMRVTGGGFPAVLQQPARSSCSIPAASSMAVVLEQKLANAVGYEPFVLTRCKSEPVKTAASKLQPESCVLENRKLERLSRAAFSVGAAGLGF